jgi:hypothetical protein
MRTAELTTSQNGSEPTMQTNAEPEARSETLVTEPLRIEITEEEILADLLYPFGAGAGA